MELEEYIINGKITQDDIARILDAKDRTAKIWAVSTSVFKQESDIGGGFFARALNIEQLLSKDYDPARKMFDEIHEKLKDETFGLRKEDLKSKSYKFADFRLGYSALTHFPGWSWSELHSYGKTVRVAMNHAELSLANIHYIEEEKALCFCYDYYTEVHVPIMI